MCEKGKCKGAFKKSCCSHKAVAEKKCTRSVAKKCTRPVAKKCTHPKIKCTRPKK